MCIVTVWHPSIGNIIPILGYVTLDTPVTVQNQNWAAIWGLGYQTETEAGSFPLLMLG
ncbi:hypothetical protein BJV74DRAFT_867676 [Russula compacta]|nr:hypothetical protein BJV74DRAFT_867676 [Russula compacta]